MVKNPPANAGDVRNAGLIPGSGRSPGGGHGNPPQYSRLENPMDRGAWQAMVHRVTKWWTQLKQLSTHTCMVILCFIIWGTARLFSKAVVAFYILTSCVWAFNISIQLLYFLFSNFLILAILVFAEWYLTMVLICISLVIIKTFTFIFCRSCGTGSKCQWFISDWQGYLSLLHRH